MEDTYLIEGEFAFESYMPLELKVGMHFLSKVNVGVIEPQSLFFTLEHVPEEPELFMSLYGAPIKLMVVSGDGKGKIWATGKEIGWFDDCEGDDITLVPITDSHINTILNEYGGKMDIQSDEYGNIMLRRGKVIISYLQEDDEEEEEEHNQLWDDEFNAK